MPRIGGNSYDRRRTRRAAQRRADRSASLAVASFADLVADLDDDSLVAAGSGSTSLPLSEQGLAWDASAADKRVRDWAGADDAPNAKYGRAFFVKQGDGSNFGDYRLGYADIVGGKLTAIWRGIVAVAGVLQGARGGVQGLSDAETASVKSKVASYYSQAAKQYDDDSIKVPWEADESKAESAITLLALAELTPTEKADLDIDHTDGRVSLIGGSGAGMDAFLERRIYWEAEFGGKPSKGTSADKRLKKNQDELPEELALERLLEFAPGDVAWGPEDGFLDLLCDINAALDELDPYRYRCVDVSVKLDAAVVCDYEDETTWVAPLSIDKDGEPVLSDRSEWKPAEDGLIEVAPGEDDDAPEGAAEVDAARIRFELRDFVLLADGALAPPLPDEHQPGETIPRRRPTPGAPKPMPTGDDESAVGQEVAWQAIFVPEGSLTDDGRAFAPGSLSWRDLPLSLMAMTETSAQGGHDGAVLAGRIDRMWREGNLIMAAGVFDSGEFGAEIARMVGDKTLRGLSVDTAIHEYEIGPRSDYFAEDGTWLTDAPTRAEGDDPDLADLLFDGEDEDRIFVVTKGVIGMATVCPFPAFADASISLVASGGGAVWRYNRQAGFELTLRAERAEALTAAAVAEETETAPNARTTMTLVPRSMVVEVAETGERMTLEMSGDEPVLQAEVEEEESLTASAAGHAPVSPPAEWFESPSLEELTPLTINDEGRVYGHAWSWDTCHIAFPDSCVLAPHTGTENAYFHLGEIECADGSKLSVGKVTLDAPHAAARLSRADATAHYDHTGTVVAHVVCGEDEFGGWVAGAIVPDLPESKLRLLQGSALSGDWRNVNGNLELVALLAVNVPGFPVPRPRALVAAGAEGTEEVLALTAAGIFVERTPCDVVAEIGELAAEIGAVPLDEAVAGEFAELLEQAEA